MDKTRESWIEVGGLIWKKHLNVGGNAAVTGDFVDTPPPFKGLQRDCGTSYKKAWE